MSISLEPRLLVRSRGFTLPELVVVIIVIGILAAAVGPKLFSNAETARDSTARQSLLVVREAIERYRADNDDLPGQSDDLPGDLSEYLRGPFPVCTVGPRNASIAYSSDPGVSGEASPTESWKYSKDSGDFIVNLDAATVVDPSVNYDEW